MPTYEYRCAQGHEFEMFQRISEPPLDRCPTCGAAAERLLSAGAGLLFRGSGFYITDYRKESYRKAAAEDSGSGGSEPAKESGKADDAGPGGRSEGAGPKSGGGGDKGASSD